MSFRVNSIFHYNFGDALGFFSFYGLLLRDYYRLKRPNYFLLYNTEYKQPNNIVCIWFLKSLEKCVVFSVTVLVLLHWVAASVAIKLIALI